MYKSIYSSWIVRILLALFAAVCIYLAIEAFKDGYREGQEMKAEMQSKAGAEK